MYECYSRIDNHAVAKQRKQLANKIVEMKNIIARYFVTCFSCPDTFDLDNETSVINDADNSGGMGGGDMQEMMNAMM